ncbi:MAG: DUF2497 domain-containing protein [Hyphomonadaceae bacterium]
MEEILASIRRIISEEESAPTQDEVLDLTEPANSDSDDLLVFDAEPAKPAPPAPAPRPAPQPVSRAPEPQTVAEAAETIISPPTVTAASGALTRLAGALRIAETPGQTIEGVVREMLKPMLKEWLDQHLPAIVEARVEAELERIARMSR